MVPRILGVYFGQYLGRVTLSTRSCRQLGCYLSDDDVKVEGKFNSKQNYFSTI